MGAELTPRDQKILTGQMSRDEIPSVKAHVVRVYLCSNGTDSMTERNAFVENVYPKLREYCRDRYGLEFQVVDLAWGLPADVVHAHQAELTPLRIREIQRCQALSAGPNFIAFIGQKYGPRSLPDVILAEDYDAIRVALHTHKARDTRNAGILDESYIIDHNNQPSVYVLKDKKTLIPDLDHESENVKKEAHNKWLELQSELRRLLKRGAEFAYLDGSLDSESKERYFVSELENQILLGLEASDFPSRRCILISRNIDDLKNYTDCPQTQQYADLVYNEREEIIEIDSDSEQLLVRLKNRICGLVTPSNTMHHTVLWRFDDVISPELHCEYLTVLCNELYNKCVQLIDESAPLPQNKDVPSASEEAIKHWSRCRYMAAQFYGQSSDLEKLRAYVSGHSEKPLILYGPNGCGKSKLVSKLVFEMEDIVHDEYILLFRYAGLTSKSCDIKQLLFSMCTQVTMVTNASPDEVPTDMKDLTKYFLHILNSVPAYMRMIVVVDGVDSLSDDHNSYSWDWLPSKLPSNVKIILTVHPTDNKVMDKLKSNVIPDEDCYLEIRSITRNECEEMLVRLLAAMDRSITPIQMKVFQEALENDPIPLYVELLANIAKDMNSFTDAESLGLPKSCADGIEKLFDRLENKHGKMLVSKALAYMVASHTGLSDCEMEDVLSLDEDVLNEVYNNYHPPLRRIPYVKWLKLKQDIESFLTYCDADGVTVAVWQHESFRIAIKNRFLNVDAVVIQIHSTLADYFLGTWAGRAKPVAVIQGKRRSVAGFNSDRKVPYQPLTFGDLYGETIRYNKRKYDQVPRHLHLSGRLQELNDLVLFNYEWLYNKISALSLQHIMADFALNPGEEASLVEESLRVSEVTIENDLNNLACEISGHLLPYYTTHPNIRSLIQQCDLDGLKHSGLVPNFPYSRVPGSSLQFTLEMPTVGEHFLFSNEERFLISKRRDDANVYAFDLQTGELKNSIFTSNGELYTTPDGKYFIVVDHITEKAIKIHDSSTGAFLKQIIFMNHIEGKSSLYKKGEISVTNDRLCAIVTLSNSVLCICDIPTGNVLHVICLDGKADICRITPNGKHVFSNSNSYLVAYDLYTLQLMFTISIGSRPSNLVFTHDGLRAFVSNDRDTKLTIMHLSKSNVDMTYRAVLGHKMPGDYIVRASVSPNDNLLMLRGEHHILVYHRNDEKVIATFSRPKEVPPKFRLPKTYSIDMKFTDAQFTCDSEFVVATIFRNAYVWKVSTGTILTVIQAPIGVITSLVVSKQSRQFITHNNNSTDIQVWNINDAVQKVNTRDKLTDAINEVQVSSDISVAFVKCQSSDELGVIDMQKGGMLDLLTHDSKVEDFTITPDGAWVLVSTTPRLKGKAFKLWNMEERCINLETGNSSGYCVGMKNTQSIIMVAPIDNTTNSEYRLSTFHFSDNEFHEQIFTQTISIVRSKPFMTYDDKYLVVSSAHSFDDKHGEYSKPCIRTFCFSEGMRMATYEAKDLKFEEHLQDILQVSPSNQGNGSIIAAIFSCKNHYKSDSDDSPTENGAIGNTYGFFLMDASTGALTRLCIPFPPPNPQTKQHHMVFTPDSNICLDSYSNAFNVDSGMYINQIPGPDAPPQVFALDGTMILFYEESLLYVVREDGFRIATCDVHAPICHLHVCQDERTIIVGCQDGTVLSYTIIDPQQDNAAFIINNLNSRVNINSNPRDRRLSRSWDKVEENPCNSPSIRRSASAIDPLSRNRDLLRQVKDVPRVRPKSDTSLSKSQACVMM